MGGLEFLEHAGLAHLVGDGGEAAEDHLCVYFALARLVDAGGAERAGDVRVLCGLRVEGGRGEDAVEAVVCALDGEKEVVEGWCCGGIATGALKGDDAAGHDGIGGRVGARVWRGWLIELGGSRGVLHVSPELPGAGEPFGGTFQGLGLVGLSKVGLKHGVVGPYFDGRLVGAELAQVLVTVVLVDDALCEALAELPEFAGARGGLGAEVCEDLVCAADEAGAETSLEDADVLYGLVGSSRTHLRCSW